MRYDHYPVMKTYDLASRGNSKFDVLPDPVDCGVGYINTAREAALQVMEARYRVASKNNSLKPVFGEYIPRFSRRHLYDNTDEDLESVFNFFNNIGGLSVDDYPHHELEDILYYRSNQWTNLHNCLYNVSMMNRVMTNLDTHGPFMIEYEDCSNHHLLSNLGRFPTGKPRATVNGALMTRYGVVKGFEFEEFLHGENVGCWKFVNTMGPRWGVDRDGCGRIDFAAVSNIYIPAVYRGNLLKN
ncbi:hypothetical protein M5689_022519 [Euphorbia peplus]|nr:hypothetical protein M5689_022519 [Euphorbia peplus]